MSVVATGSRKSGAVCLFGGMRGWNRDALARVYIHAPVKRLTWTPMSTVAQSLEGSQTKGDNPAARSFGDRHATAQVATTTVLCILGAIAIGSRSLGTAAAPRSAPSEVPAVRIVDPTFCQDQTWPYIEPRCLKRVPAQPVASVQSDQAAPPVSAPSTRNQS